MNRYPLSVLVIAAVAMAVFTGALVLQSKLRKSRAPDEAVVLLVHGLGGDGSAWQRRGFLEALTGDGGTAFRGDFRVSPKGEIVLEVPGGPANGGGIALYTVSLTGGAEGNIRESGSELGRVVAGLRERHPGARLTLVGFSLGGVIAREFLTADESGNASAVSRLICISTPHLGSELALIPHLWREWNGLPAADSGSTPSRSDLVPERDELRAGLIETLDGQLPFRLDSQAAAMLLPPDLGGAYLAELNARPHPGKVEYLCIITEKNLMTLTLREMIASADETSTLSDRVRWALLDWLRSGVRLAHDPAAPDDAMNGDGAVSLHSQDLNRTPAFAGTPLEAEVYRIEGAHSDSRLAGDLTRLILRQ